MRVIIKTEILKKVILTLMVIILTTNFIAPHYIYAISDEEKEIRDSAGEKTEEGKTEIDNLQKLLGLEDSANDQQGKGRYIIYSNNGFLNRSGR